MIRRNICPFVLILILGGCRDTAVEKGISRPTVGNHPNDQVAVSPGGDDAQRKNFMISKSKAVEIARAAIKGKINLQRGGTVDTELVKSDYIVQFRHVLPPGTAGGGTDAIVTLDAKTGSVSSVMGGPE